MSTDQHQNWSNLQLNVSVRRYIYLQLVQRPSYNTVITLLLSLALFLQGRLSEILSLRLT